jgi:hypothetical protein
VFDEIFFCLELYLLHRFYSSQCHLGTGTRRRQFFPLRCLKKEMNACDNEKYVNFIPAPIFVNIPPDNSDYPVADNVAQHLADWRCLVLLW